MDKTQLKEAIEEVLKLFGYNSPEAVDLLMGTAAQESHMGTYIEQIGGGPARGIFQMEPATEVSLWENYIKYRQKLVDKIFEITKLSAPSRFALKYNLAYQIIMARIKYLTISEPLPDSLDDMAQYWKSYYNTYKGKGTVEEFKDNYEQYVGA